jgi:hypothetical protein
MMYIHHDVFFLYPLAKDWELQNVQLIGYETYHTANHGIFCIIYPLLLTPFYIVPSKVIRVVQYEA